MSRNDLIAALIRVLGIYLLVMALLEIPHFFFGLIGGAFDIIQSAMNDSFGNRVRQIAIADTISGFATLLLRLVLGYYLMIGGKWFASKATHE